MLWAQWSDGQPRAPFSCAGVIDHLCRLSGKPPDSHACWHSYLHMSEPNELCRPPLACVAGRLPQASHTLDRFRRSGDLPINRTSSYIGSKNRHGHLVGDIQVRCEQKCEHTSIGPCILGNGSEYTYTYSVVVAERRFGVEYRRLGTKPHLGSDERVLSHSHHHGLRALCQHRGELFHLRLIHETDPCIYAVTAG